MNREFILSQLYYHYPNSTAESWKDYSDARLYCILMNANSRARRNRHIDQKPESSRQGDEPCLDPDYIIWDELTDEQYQKLINI